MNCLIWHKREWKYWTLWISPTVLHLLSTGKRDIRYLTAPFAKTSIFVTFIQPIAKYILLLFSFDKLAVWICQAQGFGIPHFIEWGSHNRSKLECWCACSKLFAFLCKYFASMQCAWHFHTLTLGWFEGTIFKEIFAIFRPMGYINHYGLIFMDSDCSFKSLHF